VEIFSVTQRNLLTLSDGNTIIMTRINHLKPKDISDLNDFQLGYHLTERRMEPLCHIEKDAGGKQDVVSYILSQLAASGVPDHRIRSLQNHSVPLLQNAVNQFCMDVGDTVARSCEEDATIRGKLTKQQTLEHYSRPTFSSFLASR
jgi:hypothetical protein